MKSAAVDRILSHKLVPAVRTSSAETARQAAVTLIHAGVEVLEIPFTVPNAASVITALRHSHPHMLVGAGTILSVDDAAQALSAGAQFIVSPSVDAAVIAFSRDHDVPSIPGVLTPSEIVFASRCGADILKVFPASAMGGPGYIRSVLAPLPAMRLMPMGGVNLETAAAYLAAGAVALGVGADLVPANFTADIASRVGQKAADYIHLIRSFQQESSCSSPSPQS